MGLYELASATLRGGERRVEVAAQNAVNSETPGYKAQVAFTQDDQATDGGDRRLAPTPVVTQTISKQGTIFETSSPLDLAINGTGYFLVRSGDEFHLSRSGQFGISSDGTIIDVHGRILQLTNGGDALTNTFAIEILSDGTMLDGDTPIGTIGLFEPGSGHDGIALTSDQVAQLEDAETSEVRQSMLERSNVTLSDAMVEMMRAQRQIESGAQMIRAYDQLLDRAVSTFGRNA